MQNHPVFIYTYIYNILKERLLYMLGKKNKN